jgi:hypothetical protein
MAKTTSIGPDLPVKNEIEKLLNLLMKSVLCLIGKGKARWIRHIRCYDNLLRKIEHKIRDEGLTIWTLLWRIELTVKYQECHLHGPV